VVTCRGRAASGSALPPAYCRAAHDRSADAAHRGAVVNLLGCKFATCRKSSWPLRERSSTADSAAVGRSHTRSTRATPWSGSPRRSALSGYRPCASQSALAPAQNALPDVRFRFHLPDTATRSPQWPPRHCYKQSPCDSGTDVEANPARGTGCGLAQKTAPQPPRREATGLFGRRCNALARPSSPG
jgi:hypothetical protein